MPTGVSLFLPAAYHHGEASLSGTIVGLAQDFVGSNNVNYLVPQGEQGWC
jgi:DNA topoisomerase-2